MKTIPALLLLLSLGSSRLLSQPSSNKQTTCKQVIVPNNFSNSIGIQAV